jgi:hypothetical protein
MEQTIHTEQLFFFQDYWAVYAKKLGLLKSVNEKDIFFRTSVETRTMQVASGLITGFDPAFATKVFPVTTQPSPVRVYWAVRAFHALLRNMQLFDRSTRYRPTIPVLTPTMSGTRTSLSPLGPTTCKPMLT